jgi:hypothetical protein
MRRVSRVDPTTGELLRRNAATVKPWAQAVPSSHLFVADLPDDLVPGTYTVTAKATDEFGRTHHAHRVLEVLGSSANAPGALRYPE